MACRCSNPTSLYVLSLFFGYVYISLHMGVAHSMRNMSPVCGDVSVCSHHIVVLFRRRASTLQCIGITVRYVTSMLPLSQCDKDEESRTVSESSWRDDERIKSDRFASTAVLPVCYTRTSDSASHSLRIRSCSG